MNAGRIAQAGSPQRLYEHPANEFVAGFMGEAMLFPGESFGGGTVKLGPLRISHPDCNDPGPVRVAVRPEAWRLAGTQVAEGLPATVVKYAYLGSVQELTVASSLGSIFVVSTDTERQWRTGDAVTLTLADHGVSVLRV